jgi:hypothetical protein
MIQFHSYSSPNGDADRLAAIAARRFFWGDGDASDLPATLPKHTLYRQEVVACLGMEHACRKYNLTPDQYDFHVGILPDHDALPSFIPTGTMLYQPRNSGFFSVIENLIVAAYVARMSGKELIVDNTYDWWNYEEKFDDIFRGVFTLVDRIPNDATAVHFDSMRDFIFNASEAYLRQFYTFKYIMYGAIERAIKRYYKQDKYSVEDAGLMFVRGGDKAQVEAPTQPTTRYIADINRLARRVSRVLVLSDDHKLAHDISKYTVAENITPTHHKGYHHNYGGKVSCLPILKGYIALVDCKESVSCPSANLVNAAHWSRAYGNYNFNTYNPVYRYALI